MKDKDSGGRDARLLETEFFATRGAKVLDSLRRRTDREAAREALKRVSRVDDMAFIDRLIAMEIRPETVIAMRLIPVAFVAWADGHIDEREREAVLRAAREKGVAAEEIAERILGDWLVRRPDRGLLELWKKVIRRLWSRFSPDEQWLMRKNLLDATKDVAEASGGFLGLGAVSRAEQAVLDELKAVVDQDHSGG